MLREIFIVVSDEKTGEILASKRYAKSKGMKLKDSFDLVRRLFQKHTIYQPLDRAPAGARFVIVYLSGNPTGEGRCGRNWDRYGIGERDD